MTQKLSVLSNDVIDLQTKLNIKEINETIIRSILNLNGINEGSADYRDYERAKKIVFRNGIINPYEYESKIEIIKEYLKV